MLKICGRSLKGYIKISHHGHLHRRISEMNTLKHTPYIHGHIVCLKNRIRSSHIDKRVIYIIKPSAVQLGKIFPTNGFGPGSPIKFDIHFITPVPPNCQIILGPGTVKKNAAAASIRSSATSRSFVL